MTRESHPNLLRFGPPVPLHEKFNRMPATTRSRILGIVAFPGVTPYRFYADRSARERIERHMAKQAHVRHRDGDTLLAAARGVSDTAGMVAMWPDVCALYALLGYKTGDLALPKYWT